MFTAKVSIFCVHVHVCVFVYVRVCVQCVCVCVCVCVCDEQTKLYHWDTYPTTTKSVCIELSYYVLL